MRIIALGIMCGLLSATAGNSAIYTVAKKGASANFTSIQAAVDKANPGDEIVIVDTSVYEEQVTIDSTKNGLVLRSENIIAKVKPTIRFQDVINVGPKNVAEAKVSEMITFDKNGALRIIKAKNVRVEGLVIDGGGALPFGYNSVWSGGDQSWPLQHGNTAICIYASGTTIIRHCSIQNAFFGMYINDLNRHGAFSISSATDGTIEEGDFTMPLSTGNQLVEKNRIHDNSFGIFFETVTDMGSTVRNNLIYKNHHRDEAFAMKVKDLTSEGGNLPGGAMLFKNQQLTPLAIYNNTFWHNHLLLVGGWRAGGQNLVFNNIFGEPETYHSEAGYMEMAKVYVNRMHNCLFAAQTQAPTSSYVNVINGFTNPKAEGDLITPKPFPESAEVRYLESHFKSTDPDDDAFLVPDWDNALVKQYIKDRGWNSPGMRDADGSLPDIGAISSSTISSDKVLLIQPVSPVSVVDGKANVAFRVYTNDREITSAKATLFGMVRNLDTASIFGNEYKPVVQNDVIPISLATEAVTINAMNFINVPAASMTGNYAFYEIVITGTYEANQVSSGMGFIPFRKYELTVKVDLLDSLKQSVVKNVISGKPYVLRVTVIDDVAGKVYEDNLFRSRIVSASGSILSTPDGKLLESLGTVKGVAELKVVFAGVPQGTLEHISVAIFNDSLLYAGCVGTSQDVTIGDGTPVAEYPKLMPRNSITGSAQYEITDLSGRIVYRGNTEMASLPDIERQVRSTLTRGVYLVKFYKGKGRQVIMQKKVVAGR